MRMCLSFLFPVRAQNVQTCCFHLPHFFAHFFFHFSPFIEFLQFMRQIVARDSMEKSVYAYHLTAQNYLPLTSILVFCIIHSENLAGWLHWLDVHLPKWMQKVDKWVCDARHKWSKHYYSAATATMATNLVANINFIHWNQWFSPARFSEYLICSICPIYRSLILITFPQKKTLFFKIIFFHRLSHIISVHYGEKKKFTFKKFLLVVFFFVLREHT